MLNSRPVYGVGYAVHRLSDVNSENVTLSEAPLTSICFKNLNSYE